MKRFFYLVSAVVIGLVLGGPLSAQENEGTIELEDELAHEGADADLAKQSQNPIGSLVSLPLQNNANVNWGPKEEVQDIFNIQPVIPISVSKGVNLVNRVILPLVYQPEVIPGQGSTTGLGDTSYTAFFAPKKPGSLIWGAGPAFSIPTATDDNLGSDQWAIGPSVVMLKMPGSWVIGGLVSNIWSTDSNDDDGDVNFFFSQIFVNYNKPSGWFYTSAPNITANWEAESGQKWTIPIGGGIGKVFRIGKQPVNASGQVFYNIEKPDFAADWTLRLQFAFLFPK